MFKDKIKLNRHELAGCFGDIGTDFPLIVGMILASGLDIPSVFIMFGLMQVATGLVYGIPMPVQPLKAMAVIVISQKVAPSILYGGGLAIGLVMLFLTFTGIIGRIAVLVPKVAIRGIQFGLGAQLALLALKDYAASDGAAGYVLAGVGFLVVILLLGNKRFPAALLVILIGIIYALTFKTKPELLAAGFGFRLPQVHTPTTADIVSGFLLLALPQIPLSLGNSILATKQLTHDLFPEKKITVPKLSLTYSFMNMVAPFFGGIPVCHGSGGMAGHYTFGARTGGSVVLYGSIYLLIGLFFSQGFQEVVKLFPKPLLGVILFFEGLALMRLVRDTAESKTDLTIALMVGVMAMSLPYGYVVGMLVGTALYYAVKKGYLSQGLS